MLNGNNCAVTSYSGKKRSLEKWLSLGPAGYFRHKKKRKDSLSLSFNGRNEGIRTLGPYVPNVVLYQAELHSVCPTLICLFFPFVKHFFCFS